MVEISNRDALAGLGARLREARRARGMTQDDVAQPEFTKSYISAVERGKARPSLRALTLIAGRLGLPVAELLTLAESAPAATDPAVLDEECAYQLDHVKLLIQSNQGDEALRMVEEIAQTYGPLLDEFDMETQYRYYRLRGAALVRAGEPGPAREALEHALLLAEQLDDAQEIFRTRNILGAALYQQNLSRQAVDQHESCFKAIEQGIVRDPQLKLNIYSNLASDYWAVHQPEQAIAMYHEARKLLEDVVNPERQAAIYWGLSQSYRATGELARAKLYAAQALGILESGTNQAAVASMTMNLAEILIGRDELAPARDLLDQAASILQPFPDPVLGATLFELYTLLELRTGDLPAAAAAAEQALALSETGQQAAAAVDAAARANAMRGRARALGVAGQVAERQGRPDLADARFREALERIAQTEDSETAAELRLTYGDLLQQRGDHAQAAAQFQQVAHGRLSHRWPRQ